jgi:predicted short-subunit dehydrogenase-like oxidoreductase (DUF2520 family)
VKVVGLHGAAAIHRPSLEVSMRIAIIGPGRVGTSMAGALERAGHDVSLVGRGQTWPVADVIWLTVPEAALGPCCEHLPESPIVLHASGATDLSIFGDRQRIGSLHPLMTFPGPNIKTPDLQNVPAAVDGDLEGLAVARQLARDLGMIPFTIQGDRRLYHAAAVIAGNGATILMHYAAQCLEAAGIPNEECSSLLAPLAMESIRNAVPRPSEALTGPLTRASSTVLARHTAALERAHLDDALALHHALIIAGRAALPERAGS